MHIASVSELHHHTSDTLAKCELEGTIVIRRRDGQEFLLEFVGKKSAWPDFGARMKRIRSEPISPEVSKRVDKAIRGE